MQIGISRVTSLLNRPTRDAAEQAGDTATSTTGRGWRFAVPVLLVIGFAAHLAWRIWLIRYVQTVVAHADEDRYLLSARALAGGPGGFGNDTFAFRRLGYPMLLAPIYSYTQDPFRVYHFAQLIGAVINAFTFPLAYLFARRVLATSRPLSLAMAFVAAALPAVVYYSEFALTDVLFAPLGLLWLLLLHGWITGKSSLGRTLAAVGAGAVVGYTYVVHVRGLVLLAVHIGLAIALVLMKRRKFALPLVSAVVAVVVSQLDVLLKAIVGNRLAHGGIEPDTKMWDAITSALGFVRTITDATGQFWYLAAATGGLGILGVIVAFRAVRSQEDFGRKAIYAVLLSSTVLIALVSAAAIPSDDRVSNHVYFRYIAWTAPIWMMIGIAALVAAQRAVRFRLMRDAGIVMGISLFVVLARMAPDDWFSPFDTPETSFLSNNWSEFRPFKVTILTLVFLAFWLTRRWLIPMSLTLALWAGAMVAINAKAIEPMVAVEYRPGSRLVQDLGVTPNDVVEQAVQVDLGSRLNHQREIYWAPVNEFDAITGLPSPHATVVIAPWNPKYANVTCSEDETAKCTHMHWDGTQRGWTLIYIYANGDRHWAMWRRDTP